MSQYIHYDRDTGKIWQNVTAPDPYNTYPNGPGTAAVVRGGDDDQVPFNDNAVVMTGRADLHADYVLDGVITPRPVLPARLVGKVLRGVPAGAVITIDGKDYVADGTNITLEFALPGTYAVTVSLWPHLDRTFSVTA